MLINVISKLPSGKGRVPLMFVHGNWHAAWCWEDNFLSYFADHGYPSYALDLRGHGDSEGSFKQARIHDYTLDVAQALQANCCAAPVLVGHSMGGLVVQDFLLSQMAALSGVVMLASPSPNGMFVSSLRTVIRQPIKIVRTPALLGITEHIASPDTVRTLFFSQAMSETDLMRHYDRLVQKESFPAYVDSVLLGLTWPIRIKKAKQPFPAMLVLGGEYDTIITKSDIATAARLFNADHHIFNNMAHDLMLDIGWEEVAKHILSWLQDREL